VIQAIDRICEYYTANEPSSPVPLLLRRAQGLVAKSFYEILEDMIPDSVAQAQIIGGDSAK
jgi:type VI secretion system protein ImpA